MINEEQYKELADIALNRTSIGVVDWSEYGEKDVYLYNGKVQPKQRPQFTKGGRAHTPKETREFEKAVKIWAGNYHIEPVTYPLEVTIHIMDGTEDSSLIDHCVSGFTYPYRGDLDNLSKGILDALNGVAYIDDKQVVNLLITRSWSVGHGFTMTMRRAGLSKFDYTNLLKYIKRAR